MNNSVNALCSAVKKIIGQLKPQSNGVSFVILTGKAGQGKKTLLRQSQFQRIITDSHLSTEIFYNEEGIIVELSETWLHHSKTLLHQTLKQLNHCHRHIRITGILLCLELHELTTTDPIELSKHIKAHSALLNRFGVSLGYPVSAGLLITKMDALAGFSEFYQHDHASDLNKPLGFSLHENQGQFKLNQHFKLQFDAFTESLGQHVLNKVHPVRSSIKRTLIREFPLQLATLRLALQSTIEAINPALFRIQALFFTSAEQGGFSLDQLNKKIHNEYALTIQDKTPLSSNYRAYFIHGALLSFQHQTKQFPVEKGPLPIKMTALLASIAISSLILIGYYHVHSSRILEGAAKEWRAVEAGSTELNGRSDALYHLTNATALLAQLNYPNNSVQKLKHQLEYHKEQQMNGIFIPSVLKEIEVVLADNQLMPAARYQAFKIYFMLGNPQHDNQKAIIDWFEAHWADKLTSFERKNQLALLNQALALPRQPLSINPVIVQDTRNYFNALPGPYLYYAIAKNSFDLAKKAIPIKGFALAETAIPVYFTKQGFHHVHQQLPLLAKQLVREEWLLDKPAPQELSSILEQAYDHDYVLWWKNFIQKSTPLRATTYSEIVHLTQILRQTNAVSALIALMQEETSPELDHPESSFNQHVAGQFTDLNLLNEADINQLTHTLKETNKFFSTLSVVNDHGKTAFTVTKSRFQGDNLSNPITLLFNESEQLPEPIASWSKRLASDGWFILMDETKRYINAEWQSTVYQDYINTVAHRFPFEPSATEEVALVDFNRFFSNKGILNTFIEEQLKPFLDTSEALWKPKELNEFVLPISSETVNEMMRANIITSMFFSEPGESSHVHFSLQKSELAANVSSLSLRIGENVLHDTPNNQSFTDFEWPQANAKLTIKSIEGEAFTLNEEGIWAFFRLLHKVEVLPPGEESARIEVLFNLKGYSGQYLLKTQNALNPFTPGILEGFNLSGSIG